MVLRTLGALELAGSSFARPKPLLLLAYLALEGPRPRRHVAELFWPRARDPLKSLTVALTRLRHGAPGVVDADRIRAWTSVESDAASLLASLDQGDVDEALRLYRGPFLDGVYLPGWSTELEEWVYETRESIARRLRQALLTWATSEADVGAFHSAARRAEQAYRLAGAPPLPPDDLLTLATLVRAGDGLTAAEIGAEAATFGLDVPRSGREARARLERAREERAPTPGGSDVADHPGMADRLAQHIAFVTSYDGTRIAYATIGEGPPLVKAANWLSHLEHDWDSPVWHHWLRALSRTYTLVRYDERGCGLSDHGVPLSLDAFVRDLEALVDALELERFPLLGMSQGAATAIAYAVRHPERVSHLVLVGGYIDPEPPDVAEVMLQMIHIGWGRDNAAFRQVFTTLFMPQASPDQVCWFNDLQRLSASPDAALALARAIFTIDARSLADRLRVPTLIVHARNDAVVPFESSRRLAAQVPGSRFVPLESANHVLLEFEPAWQRFVEEFERFVQEPAPGPVDPAARTHAPGGHRGGD
jgi:pimeloyl-ACP methyl ester carboxylesterase